MILNSSAVILPGQASTLGNFFYPQPKGSSLHLLASSSQGQNSFAHAAEPSLGVAVADRFTLRLASLLLPLVRDRLGGFKGSSSRLKLTNKALKKVFPRETTFSDAVLVHADGVPKVVELTDFFTFSPIADSDCDDNDELFIRTNIVFPLETDDTWNFDIGGEIEDIYNLNCENFADPPDSAEETAMGEDSPYELELLLWRALSVCLSVLLFNLFYLTSS